MIGHQQIIAARKSGQKPAAVFIESGEPPPANFPFEDPEQALAWNLYPTIWMQPEEFKTRHDMRFLAGCNVHIGVDRMDLVTDFAELLVEAGAARVFAYAFYDKELLMYRDGEWSACKS